MVVTLGALLGDVPHTRPSASPAPPPIPSSIDALELAPLAVRGPHRHRRRAERRVPRRRAALGVAVGAGAALRRHAAQPAGDPRAARAASARSPTCRSTSHGLDQLVDLWRVQVDHAIADNDEVTDYVRELEARIDAEDASERGIVLGGHPAERPGPDRRRPRRRGRALPPRAGRRGLNPIRDRRLLSPRLTAARPA